MVRKEHSAAFMVFLLIGTMLLAGCAAIKTDAGYFAITPRIGKESADSVKNAIRGLSNDLFEPFRYTGAGKITINYRLLRPVKSNPNMVYPLVLVLHSSGNPIGTDNISQLGVLAKLWAQPAIRERYPAFIVAPQFPRRSSNYVMDPVRHVLVSSPDPCLTTALELIDSLKNALPVDIRSIYVIGFSMGGSGVINSLDLRPDLFAAGVSISGIPSFDRLTALAKIPLWLVHGNADAENPIGSDSLLYTSLQALNDRRIRFWVIDSLGHDIYPGLYTGDAIPQWLFRH